ncbi:MULTISPECIES: PTS sugar transporter subunit IIB [Clostridium]|uniref:PTS sugar transporter subunit IIB n=1 Tax=Clostridium aquiflavi TaxID=3073603 RepID=A0ABU1EC74_9CLOT|nr:MULTISPECIES: PTS sugar transporter subunit IIB [unclassified Clostridium]MDR5585970.1 PTS sugar transporter subunit IIB [Clostridium sp. 5N-1]NFG62782.1 PTS sugar transporter subunit IIB [Clostridium botulinum]NFQ08050.1 PTS sugar transporter subunit IIB [Clostridium botulinum]
MLNIVLTRIDDRLIHGQVATAWSKITKATKIIVVDDAVAQDPFMEMVLKSAAPSSIKVEIYGVNDAINALNKDDDGERVIVLIKTPMPVLSLVKAGVAIKELNLGGMGAKQGRKQFYKNISVSDEEKEAFKELKELGVNVFVQIVPDAKQIQLDKI